MNRIASILLLFTALNVSGQNVSFKEAIDVASLHMINVFPEGSRSILSSEARVIGNEVTIYIINLSPEGWILVSGYKEAPPILGFNFDGRFTFPEQNINNPGYNWLLSYGKQLDELKSLPDLKVNPGWSQGREPGLKSFSAELISVDNLIPVEWDQGRDWNKFCPVDNDGPGGHVYVGCVAVSMAQAMSVYNKPARGIGSKEYLSDSYGLLSADYENTLYKWDSISLDSPDDYNALLLYHCAVGVEMNFGPDGSSAQTARANTALRNYFLMSRLSSYRSRSSYPDEWTDMLLEQLVNGRPIIYKGDANDGEAGHAFNIDGVINSEFFHLNWGWSGSQNGYYRIDALSPGLHDFTENHAAIFGIQPYYYPTGILLTNYMVPEDVPAGAAIGEILVVDEATDNEYDIALLTDSTYIEGSWLPDYFIDGDTIRTGKLFINGEMITDTVLFSISDFYGNLIETPVVLYADTTGSTTEILSIDRLNEFIVYPNPTHDFIRIRNLSDYPLIDIKLFSLIGNNVISISGSDLNQDIHVSDLPGGLYIIEACFSDGLRVRKRLIIN